MRRKEELEGADLPPNQNPGFGTPFSVKISTWDRPMEGQISVRRFRVSSMWTAWETVRSKAQGPDVQELALRMASQS